MSERLLASPCQIVIIIEPTTDPDVPFIGAMVVYPTAWLELFDNGVMVKSMHFDSCVPV
jgi:hypothetical protein